MKSSLVLVLSFGLAVVCRADTVRLHINGPDGQPVVGAQVRVVEIKSAVDGDDAFEKSLDAQSDATGNVSFESKYSLVKPAGDYRGNYFIARILSPSLAVGLASLRAGDNTVTLNKGQSYGGVVLDGNEKPIAGAKVSLFQLDQKRNSPTNYLFGEQKLQAQTDAQGKWSLDNIPVSGMPLFTVSAPKFKSESLVLDVSKPSPPFYLEKGATIKGRLLKPDGTPAGGVKFYAGDGVDLPVTNADGTFEVGGGKEDNLYLQVMASDSAKMSFVVPMKRVQDLQPGEVRDVGDWKSVAGFHLRGTVVDDETKKPVPNASVSAWGSGPNSYGQTDKEGHFDILISADMTSFSVNGPTYIPESRGSVPPAHDGVADAGTISIKSGRKVKGTLKTAKGEGVAAYIIARKADGGMTSAVTDEDGNFEMGGLTTGEYTLSTYDFDLVGNPKITVGTGAIAPLQLVVNGGEDGNVPRVVTGRVLSGGKPVTGAKVQIQFRSKEGSYGAQTALSDANGVYTATSPNPNRTPKILSVSRPGYGTGYGELKLDNGEWHGDIILPKIGEALRGRVVDSQGQPVVHAFVGLDKGRALPVETNAKGEFELQDTPMSGVTLLASDGPRLQSLKIEKEGDPIQIVLPDAPPATEKAALAEQLVPGSRADWEWGKQWNTTEDGSAGEILVRMRSLEGYDGGWNSLIQTLASAQPTQFLAHQDEIYSRVREANKADFKRLEMLAKAASTDIVTRAEVKAWLDAKEQDKRDITPNSVRDLLGIAEVAQKFDPKVGAMWIDYAAQINAQLPQRGGDTSWDWGQVAARISPQAVDALSEDWTPGAKLQLLASAMQTYRRFGDAANARLTFAQMEKLTAEAQNKGETVKVYGETRQPKETLNQGRAQLARTLVLTDPKAALPVIQPLDDYQKGGVLLLVARNAAKQGDLDTARTALNALLALEAADSNSLSQGAQVAQNFDATLANSMYVKAFRMILPKNEEFNDWSASIADYVEARPTQSAGASRILLEREWVQRKEIVDKQKETGYSNSRYTMKALAVAMATVSPQRALEMVEQVSTEDGLRPQARSEIAIELLKYQ